MVKNMVRTIALVGLIALLPMLTWASDLATPPGIFYPYQSSIMLQDEFTSGSASNGAIGNLGFGVGGGTTTTQSSVANRIGIIRRDTSAVISTVSSIYMNPQSANAIDPALPTNLLWIARLNNNDANTTVRIGATNGTVANPPADGIFIEKLDADTNWFCVTRAASTQTRTDSTVAVTTNFTNFAYTRNSSGVQFSINNVNVCSIMNTNIPTVFLDPIVTIVNGAAVSKTIDIDYFEIRITGIVR